MLSHALPWQRADPDAMGGIMSLPTALSLLSKVCAYPLPWVCVYGVCMCELSVLSVQLLLQIGTGATMMVARMTLNSRGPTVAGENDCTILPFTVSPVIERLVCRDIRLEKDF